MSTLNACNFCGDHIPPEQGALCGSCFWWHLEDRLREWYAGAER